MRLNKAFGMRYFNDAIKSMSIVEGVPITEEHIEKIIHYNDIKVVVAEELDTFAIKTVINLKYAWDKVISSINNPITLEYIIEINSIIAYDEALEINKLRSTPITVSYGKYTINPPDKTQTRIDIQRFLLMKEPHRYEHDILDLYIYLIVTQLFYDGNKRTAFLITNHILISMGIGILIIKEENLEDFNILLDRIYENNSVENKEAFIKFLREHCIIRKE